MNARDAAALYVSRGWYPVPLVAGAKRCRDKDWLERVYSPDDFDPDANVGIRLVAADDDLRSVKLAAVDVDAAEAVDVAASLLPPSGAAWGRDGKALSQVLYATAVAKPLHLKDANGGTIVELRVGHQSMAPPSTHPSGEVLRWLPPGDGAGGPGAPGTPTADELERACRVLATAAVCSRWYPQEGQRHDWCLALAGSLRGVGLSAKEAEAIVEAAARRSRDKKVADRIVEVRTTYGRHDGHTTGLTRLAELGGERLAATIRKLWGGAQRADGLVAGRDGRPAANSQANVRAALERMGVDLSEDAHAGRLTASVGGSPQRSLDDAVADRLWLEIDERFGFRPTRDFFDTVVRDMARRKRRHPVREYLDSLHWDGRKRVGSWLSDYAGAARSDYSSAVGQAVLVAAVRRVRQPGCKFDELLVLESAQGQNKSTALRALCPVDDWFSDDLPLGVDAKQIIERTSGKWIIEAAELVSMRKAQVEQLKSFLSRQVDGPVRLAYARLPVEQPRQFVIIGTTNSATYLRDPTGNRRFWPVKVRTFDVSAVRRDRDQLWAEAAAIEASDAPTTLDPKLYGVAELQQERRRAEDPWEVTLASALEGDAKSKQRVSPEQVWAALGVPVERRDERAAQRVSAIMQQLGFRRTTVRDEAGKVVRGWGRDLPLAE